MADVDWQIGGWAARRCSVSVGRQGTGGSKVPCEARRNHKQGSVMRLRSHKEKEGFGYGLEFRYDEAIACAFSYVPSGPIPS